MEEADDVEFVAPEEQGQRKLYEHSHGAGLRTSSYQLESLQEGQPPASAADYGHTEDPVSGKRRNYIKTPKQLTFIK